MTPPDPSSVPRFGKLAPILAIGLSAGLTSCAELEPTHELVVPVDERPATLSETAPPPISGGTLIVLRDGVTAVAADPGRDRVSIARVDELRLEATVELQPGDEPGRLVEGRDGVVHVALRGANAIARIDAATGDVTARRPACSEPRGLAFRPGATVASDQLFVACASGRLLTFEGDEPSPARSIDLESDLRDVVVLGDELWVTRFKRAELLRVGNDGTVVERRTATSATRTDFVTDPARDFPTEETHTLSPFVAWRAVQVGNDGIMVVHQRGQDDEIALGEPTLERPSAYGGGSNGLGCGGIIQSAVTSFGAEGDVQTTGGLTGVVLPVDVAVSGSGLIAVANAGLADPDAPRPFFRRRTGGDSPTASGASRPAPASGGVALLWAEQLAGGSDAEVTGCTFPGAHPTAVEEPVTAVAFTPSNTLVAQRRGRAELIVLADPERGGHPQTIDLWGERLTHTGHELFHRDTGAGIACASCHPEGAEDGRAWKFEGFGTRRTQTMLQDLAATAPFHWDGTLPDVAAVMEDTLVGRMGGVHQSPERMDAIRDWLFSLEAPAPAEHEDEGAVARGETLFAESGCADCHGGAALTDNEAHDLGGEVPMQTPTLAGVAYRAPFFHDGCAENLETTFRGTGTECGGTHGDATLTASESNDLAAYLRSL